MKRILPRSVYSCIVGTIIVTMSVNPASAGWLLNKMKSRGQMQGGAAHCQVVDPCQPICCEVISPVELCCGSTMPTLPSVPMSGSGCCGVTSVHGGEVIHDGALWLGEPVHESPMSEETWSAPMADQPSSAAPSSTAPSDTDETSSSDIVNPAPADATRSESAEPTAPPASPRAPRPAPPQPAQPSLDNLFDEPAAPPAAPAPAPAADPAADDLFGDAPAATPAAPPAEAPADDLFGEPTPAAPAEAAPMDDLFGEPAAPATPPADAPAADDIFGTPPATPADPAAPATPAEPAKDSLDDLFGSESASVEADSFAGGRVRVWIDNTGEFSTEGRLVEVGEDFIRLLKSNGRTCTVTHSRLCAADVAYVAAIAHDHDGVKVAMVSAR